MHALAILNKLTMLKHLLPAACYLLFLTANGQTPELILAAEDDVVQGIQELGFSAGKLFFKAGDAIEPFGSPWVTDGTPGGTELVVHIPGGGGYDFTEANGITFFSGADANGDQELWKTDGTAAGTNLVADIHPTDRGCKQILTEFDGRIYFVGNDGTSGDELWASDGTLAGTIRIKDIHPGSGNGLDFPEHRVFNGRLYFTATDAANNKELWATDGTEAGTVLVKDIHTAGSSTPSSYCVVGGRLYFSAGTAAEGRELWKSDGTSAGTIMVTDLEPGAGNTAIAEILEYDGNAYFLRGFSEPKELWVSDGTGAGTVLVEDSVEGTAVYNGDLYFGKAVGYTAPFHRYALYRTDGTPGGGELVKVIEGGNSQRYPRDLTVAHGKLYFLCLYDGVVGGANYITNDLWVTDGTAENTRLITTDAGTPAIVYTASGIVKAFGDLFFVAADDRGLYKLADPGSSITAIAGHTAVSVYPNPATDMVRVSFGGTASFERARITDSKGQQVADHWFTNVAGEQTLSIGNYPAGMYFMHLSNSRGEQGVARFVKE